MTCAPDTSFDLFAWPGEAPARDEDALRVKALGAKFGVSNPLLHQTGSPQELAAAMEQLDADGSGTLSFEQEFLPWWHEGGLRVQREREARIRTVLPDLQEG